MWSDFIGLLILNIKKVHSFEKSIISLVPKMRGMKSSPVQFTECVLLSRMAQTGCSVQGVMERKLPPLLHRAAEF